MIPDETTLERFAFELYVEGKMNFCEVTDEGREFYREEWGWESPGTRAKFREAAERLLAILPVPVR